MTDEELINKTLPAGCVTLPPALGALVRQMTAVGSRATCEPAPMTTDRDWLALVDVEKITEVCDQLLADGWVAGGSIVSYEENTLPESERFSSFTKGVENLIITCSEVFHVRFLAASAVAKRLNLLSKADRIALFQAVLYGASCDPTFNHFPTYTRFTEPPF